MRSLYQALGLWLVFVPALAASCSGDDSAGSGGNAGAPQGGANEAGANTGGSAASGKGNSGGTTAGNGLGGAPSLGDGGALASAGAPTAQGGLPDLGDAGGPSALGGAGGMAAAGAAGAGAGGEAGAPGAPNPVIVFDAGPHSTLNFGGRVGLDQHCATAKAAQSIPGAFTHALISVSADDEMRDMPTLYGLPTDRAFVGPTGKQVAANWADLLDGSIAQSLSSAGISSAQFWISGSNPDGSVRTTCNGWTFGDFSQQVTGTYGYPSSVDSHWVTVSEGDVYCSAVQYNVICVAYD